MSGFALGIRYLTGYAVATNPVTRDVAEWPPHPGRVFMALASAHFETGEDPTELAALEWLEALEAPALNVSPADHRTVTTHFVPVNDSAGPSKASLQSAPAFSRDRAGRTFPRVRPHDDTVHLVWPDRTLDLAHRQGLEGLCKKVIRIGHSSSLVQMWCGDVPHDLQVTLQPTQAAGDTNLRIVGPGALEYLKRQYNVAAVDAFARLSDPIAKQRGAAQRSAKAEFKREFGVDWKKSLPVPGSRRPVLSLWQRYRRIESERDSQTGQTVFDPALIILRLEPWESRYRRLGLVSTLRVTDVLRKAVQHVAGRDLGLRPIPEVLTGHKPDGDPSERPHFAYLPLAFVGDRHADGHLMGIAVAFPREEHWPDYSKERRLAMAVLSQVTELTLGQLGTWQVKPELRETPPYSLVPDSWTAFPSGSKVWASVTPVVFDEHPKGKDSNTYSEALEAMIGRACVRVGLTRPARVSLTPVSKHVGAPSAREFPRLCRKDGGERRHSHVIIEFARPVCGPVLLGAGRYRGYGLCRPVGENGEGV
jgi:CRISPR-associated protein Csb2